MKNTITYKNYIGSIEYDKDDNLFYGKILGISSLISYQGRDKDELINDFHNAIDDYLIICQKENINIEA